MTKILRFPTEYHPWKGRWPRWFWSWKLKKAATEFLCLSVAKITLEAKGAISLDRDEAFIKILSICLEAADIDTNASTAARRAWPQIRIGPVLTQRNPMV